MFYLSYCRPGTTIPTVDPTEVEAMAEQYRQNSETQRNKKRYPTQIHNPPRLPADAPQRPDPNPLLQAILDDGATASARRRASSTSTAAAEKRALMYSNDPRARISFRVASATTARKRDSEEAFERLHSSRTESQAFRSQQSRAEPADPRTVNGTSSRTWLKRSTRSGAAAVTAGVAPSLVAAAVAGNKLGGGSASSASSLLQQQLASAGGSLGHDGLSLQNAAGSSATSGGGFTCGLCLNSFGGLAAQCGDDDLRSRGGAPTGAAGDGSNDNKDGGNNTVGAGSTSGGASSSGASQVQRMLSKRKRKGNTAGEDDPDSNSNALGSHQARPAALVTVRAIVAMRNSFLQRQHGSVNVNQGDDDDDLGASMSSPSNDQQHQHQTSFVGGTEDEDGQYYDEHGEIVDREIGAAGYGKRVAVYSGRLNRTRRDDNRAALNAIQHGYETVALCRFCAQFFGVHLGSPFSTLDDRKHRKEEHERWRRRNSKQKKSSGVFEENLLMTPKDKHKEQRVDFDHLSPIDKVNNKRDDDGRRRSSTAGLLSSPMKMLMEPSSSSSPSQRRGTIAFSCESDSPLSSSRRSGGPPVLSDDASDDDDDDDQDGNKAAATSQKQKQQQQQPKFDYSGPSNTEFRNAAHIASLKRRIDEMKVAAPLPTIGKSARSRWNLDRSGGDFDSRKEQQRRHGILHRDESGDDVSASSSPLQRGTSGSSLAGGLESQRMMSDRLSREKMHQTREEMMRSRSPRREDSHLDDDDDDEEPIPYDAFVIDDLKRELTQQEETEMKKNNKQQEQRAFGTDLTNQQQQQQDQKEDQVEKLEATHSIASVAIVPIALNCCVVPTAVSSILPRVIDASVTECNRVVRLEISPSGNPRSSSLSSIEDQFISNWKQKVGLVDQQQQQQENQQQKAHVLFLLASCRLSGASACCSQTSQHCHDVIAENAPSSSSSTNKHRSRHHHETDSSSASFSLTIDGMPSQQFCISCLLVKMAASLKLASPSSQTLIVVLDCGIALSKLRKLWRQSVLSFDNVVLVAPSSYDPLIGRLTSSFMLMPTQQEHQRASPIVALQQVILNGDKNGTTQQAAFTSMRRNRNSNNKIVFAELLPGASFLGRPSRALQLSAALIGSSLRFTSLDDAALMIDPSSSSISKEKPVGVCILLNVENYRQITLANAANIQRAISSHFLGAEEQWVARVCASTNGSVFVFLMPTLDVTQQQEQQKSTNFVPRPPSSSSSSQLPSQTSAGIVDAGRVVLTAAHVLARRRREGRLNAAAGFDVCGVCVVAQRAANHGGDVEVMATSMLEHIGRRRDLAVDFLPG